MKELEIGDRIRQLRMKLGLSQIQLAKALGLTQNAISRYESGVVPRWPLLIQLSQLAHTTTDWILMGDGPEPTPQSTPRGLKEFLKDPDLKLTYNYTTKEIEELKSILFTKHDLEQEHYIQLLLLLRRISSKSTE